MDRERPWNAVRSWLVLVPLLGCTGDIHGAGEGRGAHANGGAGGASAQAGATGSSASGGAGGTSAGAGSGGASGEAGAGASAAACDPALTNGAPVPVRRLTAPQLAATVRDVLGADIAYPINDETLLGYRANTTSALDATTARVMLTTAEQIAAAAAPALLTDPACEADCGSFLLDALATRMFRRPLDAATRARFAALYAQGETTEGRDGAVRWLLTAMLQSPRFVYMLEASDAGGRLDAYSIASRLSYALWAGPPDEALLEAAAGGALDDAAGVADAAERMIDDPKLTRGLTDFARQWLSLEQLDNTATRPDIAALDEETRAALAREPVELLAQHVRSGATLAELLTATQTPAEPALASIYGDDVLSTEDDLARLDPEKRAGLLALPGVLAALSHAEQTSPTLRGRAVLAGLLCRPPAPPPPEVNPSLPPSMPGATTRERLEAHFSDDSCSGCHASMDGIGFAFERFDWLGRSRELDNGRTINSSSDFEIAGEAISVEGAPDMARALAARADVASCFARHFSRFAIGVRETKDFDCARMAMADAAQGEEGLRGMLIAFVTSEWFLEPVQEGM
jgi:hypothetical protein